MMYTRVKQVYPNYLIALILLMVAFVPISTASADIGPSPSLHFIFDFSSLPAEPTIEEFLLYECDDISCSTRQLLPEVPGQYLDCDADGCDVWSLLTGGETWQIEVSLADRLLLSEPFIKEGFTSTYNLVFLEDTLRVELVFAVEDTSEPFQPPGKRNSQTWGLIGMMLVAGVLTILIETPIAAFMFRRLDLPARNLLWVVVGNVLSIPVVWLILPVLLLEDWIITISILLTSTALETLVLGFLGGVRMSWKKALIVSSVINIVSFAVGVFGFQYLLF